MNDVKADADAANGSPPVFPSEDRSSRLNLILIEWGRIKSIYLNPVYLR